MVFNPKSGLVEVAKVFDTYKKSKKFDKFVKEGVPKGHYVIAACMDDGSSELSHRAKVWFAQMGSTEIWDIGYREGFAFIGISGVREAHERKAIEGKETVSVTQIFQLDINFDGRPAPENCGPYDPDVGSESDPFSEKNELSIDSEEADLVQEVQEADLRERRRKLYLKKQRKLHDAEQKAANAELKKRLDEGRPREKRAAEMLSEGYAEEAEALQRELDEVDQDREREEAVIANRRENALIELIYDGEYFSEE